MRQHLQNAGIVYPTPAAAGSPQQLIDIHDPNTLQAVRYILQPVQYSQSDLVAVQPSTSTVNAKSEDEASQVPFKKRRFDLESDSGSD